MPYSQESLARLVSLLDNSNLDFALLISNSGGHTCKVEKEFLCAVGTKESITSLHNLKEEWHFGWIEYSQVINSPFKVNLFVPEIVFENPEDATHYLEEKGLSTKSPTPFPPTTLKCETSKDEFLTTVTKIKNHIRLGDIYELNYCVRHSAKDVNITPSEVFLKLNQLSQAPYAGFARIGDQYLISVSPERFIKKHGNTLTIEPMKGTARRQINTEDDSQSVRELQSSEKERAENVMIVDLSRNDLSRICLAGTVKVEELCKVYSFQNVHQMVSKVTGQMHKQNSIQQIFEATFPMGSMTGAPKQRAMELINQYETFHRKMYSGSFGYIDFKGDFDFNVLIRTIFYDSANRSLYFATGGAITINSDPEKEWEEMQLKAETLKKVLG